MESIQKMLLLCGEWFSRTGVPLPWRETRDPYRIWISEIMLQQTRIETVIPYYDRFLRAVPDVFRLAALPDETLYKLWEGLGYYSRARNLKKCAGILCSRYQGAFPRTAKELETLPGIGAYTAGAIASIAFGEPSPAVDGNVLRVFTRVFAREDDVAKPQTRKEVSSLLAAHYPSGKKAGEVTEGLMEIGERCCLPNGAPLCDACPLSGICLSKDGLWRRLPVKSPKKERRIEEKTVFLLFCGGKVALEKRGESGLLAGLYGFPAADGRLDPKEAASYLLSRDLPFHSLSPCGSARHIFTHVEWRMTGFRASLEAPSPAFCWADPDELERVYALPSAFRAFRKMVKK